MSDDADIEFEGMSDAQLDAECERLMREYQRMLEGLTPEQLYRYRRNRTLDLIAKQRRLIAEFPDLQLFKGHLRSSQRRLLRWRIEYRTGAQVGHA